MAGEFRYPLTRYCLRSGTLTLPQAMVGLFPETGTVTAVDTKTDAEHELTFEAPRTVLGLGQLFREHKLAVNDELNVRALEDGRFAITPVARVRTPDYQTEEGISSLLGELIESSVRMTEQEIRAVYEVPEAVDLAGALRDDGRFTLYEGRWVNAASLAVAGGTASTERRAEQPNLAGEVGRESTDDEAVPVAVGASRSAEASAVEAPGPRDASSVAGFGEGSAQGSSGSHGQQDAHESSHAVEGLTASAFGDSAASAQHLGHSDQQGAGQLQAGLWPRSVESAGRSAERSGQVESAGPSVSAGQVESAVRADSVHERRAPAPSGRPVFEPDDEEYDASEEAIELTGRFRRVMEPLGYQIEPLGRGQLRVVSAMGRRGYKALVQLLSRGERLDWADLLSKRRGQDFRHLAVVGDHQALLRLTGPAELARATLWSWQGLERLATLNRTVPLSPIDLEGHFERDGLFEQGLTRFESAVAERVAERGALSEVLGRLNQMRAPAVFLLEDLVSEMNMPRDRVLGILERLAAAPFHLVARVDHGEFVLRQRVDAALEGLSSYALSLKERLPSRGPERLTGSGEPDLLVEPDDEVQDQPEDELTSEGGISA